MTSIAVHRLAWVLLAGVLGAGSARATIDSADLNLTRSVSQGDWLHLRLEVLGLNLSYPAYRIHLEYKQDQGVVFTFSASSGMVQHLDEAGSSETEKVLAYHARGIRQQVSDMIQEQFPELWPRFNAADDFRGQFLAPGDDWEDPPRLLGEWRGERLILKR